MSVRAKFKVGGITRSMGQKQNPETQKWEPREQRTISFSPVYGNGDPNHENTKFWQATPCGEIKLTCVDIAAAESFELDKEYYVDFTPAG
jgi:hypothetical protein